MARVRVLLAEGHRAVAEHLRAVLEVEGGYEVIAVVGDGFGLVGAAQSLKPDVIVADVTLPGLDGILAASEVLRGNPGTRVVFVTMHNEAEVVKRAFDAGACGYVITMTAGDDLIPAVEAALRGEYYASPSVFGADTRPTNAGRP